MPKKLQCIQKYFEKKFFLLLWYKEALWLFTKRAVTGDGVFWQRRMAAGRKGNNYVNALLEDKYMPMIQGQTSLGFMVIQAILIEKGICTGEEIEEITKKFVAQRQQEAQKAQAVQAEPKQNK